MGKRVDVPGPAARPPGGSGAGPVLSCLFCVAEFCLLQGKHGGFEHERSDLVFLEPLPFIEFAFRDMPDAGQEPSAPDEPLSVLKQGRVGGGLGVLLSRWPVLSIVPQEAMASEVARRL